jgi:predicted nucleic acid-binding protein
VSIYLDASAFLKLYLKEPDSDRAEDILLGGGEWVTGRHTTIEVRRNLSRYLGGADLAAAQRQFQHDWTNTAVVDLTEEVCEAAAQLAEITGVRSLDALHLGAAQVIGGGRLPLVTFDLRQAQAARTLGWTVIGS